MSTSQPIATHGDWLLYFDAQRGYWAERAGSQPTPVYQDIATLIDALRARVFP
jgi:hypothetical protein